jgi:superfamily I DNA/RNA helicase
MEDQLIAQGTYEAVFVDEAQDFAPLWFDVIRRLVNPRTSILFLAADATQRIYRTGFSWRSLGLNVQGRTAVLRKGYRNPPSIQRLAYELVREDEGLQRELREAGEDLVEIDIEDDDGDGANIEFVRFSDEATENRRIADQIRALADVGYAYSDIAVFHRYGWGVEEVVKSQ